MDVTKFLSTHAYFRLLTNQQRVRTNVDRPDRRLESNRRIRDARRYDYQF